jgi:hypothetical protein
MTNANARRRSLRLCVVFCISVGSLIILSLHHSHQVVGQTVLSPMGEAFLASQERFIAFKDQSSLDGVERLFGMR